MEHVMEHSSESTKTSRQNSTNVDFAKSTVDYSKASAKPQVVFAIIEVLGAFCSGTTFGWSSPVQPQLESNTTLQVGLQVSADEMSWVASLVNVGCLSGSLVGGVVMDSIGRKKTQILVLPPLVLGWLLLVYAQNTAMLYSGRIICGLSAGIGSVVTPAYIGEISTPLIRGMLGSLFQLFICIGILFVYSAGMGLSWRWLSLASGVLPLIVFVAMVVVPESRVKKGRRQEAEASLRRLRGRTFPVTEEFEELEGALRSSTLQKERIADLFRPEAWKPLAVGLGLMATQQLCGNNAAIFYTVDIFQSAGSSLSPGVSTIIIAAVEVGATLLSTVLVDRLGRRVLLLTSDILMCLAMAALGALFYIKDSVSEELAAQLGWLPLVSLIVFIGAFSIGFGPLPWLMLSEILPANVKGTAASIATFLNWLLAFLVTKLFVDIQRGLTRAGSFWFFGCCSLVSTACVWFAVPETKGKSPKQVAAFFATEKKN